MTVQQWINATEREKSSAEGSRTCDFIAQCIHRNTEDVSEDLADGLVFCRAAGDEKTSRFGKVATQTFKVKSATHELTYKKMLLSIRNHESRMLCRCQKIDC